MDQSQNRFIQKFVPMHFPWAPHESIQYAFCELSPSPKYQRQHINVRRQNGTSIGNVVENVLHTHTISGRRKHTITHCRDGRIQVHNIIYIAVVCYNKWKSSSEEEATPGARAAVAHNIISMLLSETSPSVVSGTRHINFHPSEAHNQLRLHSQTIQSLKSSIKEFQIKYFVNGR